MSNKNYVLLYNASAAASGTWYPVSGTYGDQYQAVVQVSLNASDTILIEGTTLEAKDATALAAIITAADIVTIKTFSSVTSGFQVIDGPWTFIRATKTGTTANAKVQGQF